VGYHPAMPCPCCVRGLVPANHPAAREGDWYCAACEWVFLREMTQGEDPLKLDAYLRCPKHVRTARFRGGSAVQVLGRPTSAR
jgi:hypothetical protein